MKKILVVDDRPANISLMVDILEGAGYVVISALDGEKGIKAAVDQHPDLIISDILMPNVDGFQFCRMVRTTPDLASTPFLFLTGAYVNEEDQAFALKIGANQFVRRPVDTDEFLDIIQGLIHSPTQIDSTIPDGMDESEYLQQHVHRLTQALEDKVLELEAVSEQNARLLREAKKHETQLKQNLNNLQETQGYLVQSERLSAVGQLVAGIAHELNNPLAIILGYTQLVLRMPEASPRMADCLNKLEEATNRCQGIVHHLTIFAQKHNVEKRHLDINDIVRSVVDIRKDQFEQDQIQMDISLAPQPLMVFADFQQLQQVFLSLINNAQEAFLIKTTSAPVIRINTRREKKLVVIDFIDNGPGVEGVDTTKLFEPFFTTKELGQGIGLGLSVCYGIIKEHQGEIEVLQTHGGGATFRVVLPSYHEDDGDLPNAEAQETSTSPPDDTRIKTI